MSQLASLSVAAVPPVNFDLFGAGAIGGKIAGAGGGGFLLLYVPFERQNRVRVALHGLQELPFRLEADGTKVIFNYRRM